MKRIVTTMLCGFYLSCAVAQHVSGQYITDGHWDLKKNVNWVNLLRLNLSISAIAMETTPSPVCASIVISNPSQLLSHKKC